MSADGQEYNFLDQYQSLLDETFRKHRFRSLIFRCLFHIFRRTVSDEFSANRQPGPRRLTPPEGPSAVLEPPTNAQKHTNAPSRESERGRETLTETYRNELNV